MQSLMRRLNHRNQAGFTLVELTISMALFSLVFLALSASVVQLFKVYNAGVNIRMTQQSARAVSEEIVNQTRKSQYAATINDDTAANPAHAVCLFTTQTGRNISAGTTPIPNEQYNGIAYFLSNTAGQPTTWSSTTDRATRQIRAISLTNKLVVPGVNPGCSRAWLTSGSSTVISTSDVSVLRFDVSSFPTNNPRLVNLALSVAGTGAVDEINYAGSPLGCLGDAKYCSVTNLSTASGIVNKESAGE